MPVRKVQQAQLEGTLYETALLKMPVSLKSSGSCSSWRLQDNTLLANVQDQGVGRS